MDSLVPQCLSLCFTPGFTTHELCYLGQVILKPQVHSLPPFFFYPQKKCAQENAFGFNLPFLFAVKFIYRKLNHCLEKNYLKKWTYVSLQKHNKDKDKKRNMKNVKEEVSKCDNLSGRFRSHREVFSYIRWNICLKHYFLPQICSQFSIWTVDLSLIFKSCAMFILLSSHIISDCF